MHSDEVLNVKFLKRSGMYMKDDQAGFPREQAEFLINAKACIPLREKPVAKRGDPLNGVPDRPSKDTEDYDEMIEAEVEKEVQRRLQNRQDGGGKQKHNNGR